MDNEIIKNLITSIKSDSKEVPQEFFKAAYANLAEKVMDKRKEVAKILFRKKETQ